LRSSLALSVSGASTATKSRVLPLIVAASLAALAGAGVLAARSLSRSARTETPAASTQEAAEAPTPPLVAPDGVAKPDVTATATALACTAVAAATASASAARRVERLSSTSTPKTPIAPSPASPASKASCEPPYYYDARGNRVFKKECL
jgi:hypothetical protein